MRGVSGENFQGTERFAILRRLGEGGFGVVYQAYDRRLNISVALKTLRRFEAAALYRFKQEFRALADVTHPNLVTLYELLSDGEEWFFTMELIEGQNLLEYVLERTDLSLMPTLDVEPERQDTGVTQPFGDTGPESRTVEASSPLPALNFPLNVERLRDAFAQLAEGVCALHEAGILHRDIKPSNVLVTREGRVVLLDFGLAAELAPADLNQSVHVVGTPSYMSPEQAAALAVSEASDWYSVGVMLYEALTGRLPFTGAVPEILLHKQKLEPPAPAELVRDLPVDLNGLCQDLLCHSARERPSGREVLRRLGGRRAEARGLLPPPSPAQRALPLVGRERHLKALLEAFWTTKEGRAVTVCVHGKSGMGKTALISRFLKELRPREQNAVLLAGRCYERESVPYKALDSLVDALSQYLKRLPSLEVERIMPRDVLALARLFPVLREVEAVAAARRRVLEIPNSQELRRRAFGALRELLARLADQKYPVLFIDDLQWGDLDSGALLAELLRPPDPPALLLIVSYRSEEGESSPLLRTFLSSLATAGSAADVRQVAVGELTPMEARELALALLGQQQPASLARAEAIARESGGSPFFLNELVRYAAASPGAAPGEATEETSLDAVIQARVSRTPEKARRLLEVVAVAGQPLKREVAWRAAELLGEEHAALDLLRGLHLVQSWGTPELDEIETYHDRIRETVVVHLSPEALRAHHLRLALTLEASEGADPETLAVHFQEAGDPQNAAKYVAQAANQAAKALAFDRAARLYRLALELQPMEGSGARALRVKLGDALANAGRGPEAAQAFLAAAQGAGAAEALELQRRVAEQLLFSGHIDECLPVLGRVLGMVGMKLAETPRRAFLSLLAGRVQLRLRGLRFRERDVSQLSSDDLMRIDSCWTVSSGLSMVDVIRGAAFSVRHLLLALRSGEPYRISRALALEAAFRSARGGHTQLRAQLLQTAMALAERVGNPHALGLAILVAGSSAHLEGSFQKSRELCQQAEGILRERCTGFTKDLDSAQIFWLDALEKLGEWEELFRRLPALIKEAQDRGDLYLRSCIMRRVHLIYLAADDPDRAREEARRSTEGWSQQGFHLQHYFVLVAEGQIDLYSGQTLAAWNRVTERWPALTRSLLLQVPFVLIETLYLRACSALALAADVADRKGHPDRTKLLEQAERDARQIEGKKAAWGNALAQLVRAGVAATRGDAKRTVTLLASAERGFEAARMAHYLSAVRQRRGELIGGDQGKALREAAGTWMAAQKMKNPDRITAMLAPGKWR